MSKKLEKALEGFLAGTTVRSGTIRVEDLGNGRERYTVEVQHEPIVIEQRRQVPPPIVNERMKR